MNQRQTVDQNRNVVSGVVIALRFDILVDDLQPVIVNVFLVDQRDVLRSAVRADKGLNRVVLYFFRFSDDFAGGILLFRVANVVFEKIKARGNAIKVETITTLIPK